MVRVAEAQKVAMVGVRVQATIRGIEVLAAEPLMVARPSWLEVTHRLGWITALVEQHLAITGKVECRSICAHNTLGGQKCPACLHVP